MKHQIIIGAAGTGKSYQCNKQIETNPYFCYRTSTTGVSALNMIGDNIIEGNDMKSGGGRTINSALGFSDTKDIILQYQKGAPKIKRNLRLISEFYERIAIDEVFMLNSFVLDVIYKCIEEHNKNINYNPIYLYLMGDIGQLKPVEGAPIFKAECWNKIHKEYLNKVYRQKNYEFIKVLNNVRKGNIKEDEEWIKENINFSDQIDKNFDGITVMTTNKAVDSYNIGKLMNLKNPIKQYHPTKSGNPGSLWNNLRSPIILCLGARVMITCNNLTKNYANGSLGVITKLEEDKVTVRLDRNKEEVVIKYVTNNNVSLKGEIVGSISYLPIKLAWATTLYKLQGLTVNGKLQAVVKGDKFLKTLHGGLYTLLSRMVNPEDLTIVGEYQDLVECNYINKEYRLYIK